MKLTYCLGVRGELWYLELLSIEQSGILGHITIYQLWMDDNLSTKTELDLVLGDI